MRPFPPPLPPLLPTSPSARGKQPPTGGERRRVIHAPSRRFLPARIQLPAGFRRMTPDRPRYSNNGVSLPRKKTQSWSTERERHDLRFSSSTTRIIEDPRARVDSAMIFCFTHRARCARRFISSLPLSPSSLSLAPPTPPSSRALFERAA